jgi:methyltransferase family protein
LDTGSFDHIPSQTTLNDKRALLALHAANRQRTAERFAYLEIGSHLGGSLQALVVDPACAKIFSIDPRPKVWADERGLDVSCNDNSSARMLQLLGSIPGADTSKIETFESDTESLDPRRISSPPDFCLIDGEHTDAAALHDAQFCLKVVSPNGCLAFHDANIVYGGIALFLKELTNGGRQFRPYILSDSIFVIELGNCEMADKEPIRSLLKNNYEAYLFALKSNEWYRAALNKPLFRTLRRMRFVRRLFLVPGLEEQGV